MCDKIQVVSLVVDQACPHGGCEACEAEARTRAARRQAIIDAQGRLFDEAAVPSSTPAPVYAWAGQRRAA